MRLSADRLQGQLQRELAPVYLITGDEPLLVGEAADAVRRAAREQGFEERNYFSTGTGFDWSSLHQAGGNLSLFAQRRIIELNMTTAKPGDAGGKALRAWAAAPPEDTLLLITAPKFDKNTQKTKWVADLEKAGVMVQIWPVDPGKLAGWIAGRMRQKGLEPDREAVEAIAARVEGNLLAADQEIRKLLLLFGEGKVDGELARRAVQDSARFDVFQLADSALAGDAERVERIYLGLLGEGVGLVLINWALTKEVRLLVELQRRRAAGESDAQAMAAAGIWQRRQPLFKSALRRLGHTRCLSLLETAARVDRTIKGRGAGDAEDACLALAMGLAGVELGLWKVA